MERVELTPKQPVLPKVFRIDDWRVFFAQPSTEQITRGRKIIFEWLPPESVEQQLPREEYWNMVDSGLLDLDKFHSEHERGRVLVGPKLPRELEIIAANFFISLGGEFEEVGNTSRKILEKLNELTGVHITETGKKIHSTKNSYVKGFDELCKQFDNYNNSTFSWIIFSTYHSWQLGIIEFPTERELILKNILRTI